MPSYTRPTSPSTWRPRSSFAPATVEEPGALAMPGQRLAALAVGFPAGETIHIGNDEAAARIACGRSRFRLPVIPQEDVPAAPAIAVEHGRVELTREEALKLFERPLFASDTEATRYYMNGIFLHDIDGALAAVGTDGHRLAEVVVSGTGGASQDGLIVPRIAVRIIIKLLGNKQNERIVVDQREMDDEVPW
jgi:DNA polymerase III subunit beta